MRRATSRVKGTKPRDSPKELMVEDIQKPRRKQRNWRSMTDEELIEYAGKFVNNKGIRGRHELEKKDSCLYNALQRRDLLNRLGLEKKKNRDWSQLEDQEVLRIANNFISERKITSKEDIRKLDAGLHKQLWKRGLFPSLEIQDNKINWSGLSDSDLLKHAEEVIEIQGISSKNELREKDSKLYYALWRKGFFRKHKLLDNEKGQRKNKALRKTKLKKLEEREWSGYNDAELLHFAQSFIREKKIRHRTEIKRQDAGLYEALRKRGLLDYVGLERRVRKWNNISDEEVLRRANILIETNGIESRKDLDEFDGGLYRVLWSRDLLKKIPFKADGRKWCMYDAKGLVYYANKLIIRKNIENPSKLCQTDASLYWALVRRKLMEKINFKKYKKSHQKHKRRKWRELSDEQLLSHARRFMKAKGIFTKSQFIEADSGLYAVLGARKLRGAIEFGGKRNVCRRWTKLNTDEIFKEALLIIKEKGLKTITELKEADGGLWHALRKRKILNQVFAQIQAPKLLSGLSQAADSMEQFGEQS